MRKRLDMTSTTQKNGHITNTSAKGKSVSPQRAGKLRASPDHRSTRRVSSTSSSGGSTGTATKPVVRAHQQPSGKIPDTQPRITAIEQCVQNELRRYYEMLDGEEPANLYRMVIRQAENAVINMVLEECRGNQTRASEWLGISRGNLRTKLANMDH